MKRRSRPALTPPRSPLLVLPLLALCACTTAAPWGKQGTAGQPCYPELTCDRGLVCLKQTCTVIPDPGNVINPSPDLSPSCPTSDPPLLQGVPATTPYLQVPIQGTASAGTVVVIVSGESEAHGLTVAQNEFCTEMSLTRGQSSDFEVASVDADGCASPTLRVTVAQRQPTGKNVLAGLKPFTSGDRQGEPSVLTDESTQTSLRLSFRDHNLPTDACDASVYVWFALPQRETIDQVEVRYPAGGAGSRYMRCWALVTADGTSADVDQPAIGAYGWRSVGGSQNGTSSDFRFNIPDRAVSQLALLMFEDGDSTSEEETFDLAEVRAYSPATVEPYQGCPTP